MGDFACRVSTDPRCRLQDTFEMRQGKKTPKAILQLPTLNPAAPACPHPPALDAVRPNCQQVIPHDITKSYHTDKYIYIVLAFGQLLTEGEATSSYGLRNAFEQRAWSVLAIAYCDMKTGPVRAVLGIAAPRSRPKHQAMTARGRT